MKINDIYLDEKNKEDMQRFFEDNGFLQIQDFLDENVEGLREEIKKEKFENVYLPEIMKRSEILEKNLKEFKLIQFVNFFKSKEFLKFLEEITQSELSLKDFKICKYKHKDFILINDRVQREECYDIFFDFSDDWKNDFGGTYTYLNSKEEIFYLKPHINSFTIVSRDESILNYLKYINNHAGENNIFRIEIKVQII